jgi:hypothetical protein
MPADDSIPEGGMPNQRSRNRSLKTLAYARIPIAALFAVAALLSAHWLAGRRRGETRADSQKPVTQLLIYAGAWGMRGDGPGQLDQPVCIATDVVGDVYMADSGSYFIHKFNWRGTPLLSFQDPLLKNPRSIAIDSGGAIYVTDSGRASTFIFLPDGARYRELRLGTRPKIDDVLSVAVADDGVINVLDPDARRVFTYSSRLRLARSWSPTTDSPNQKVPASSIADGHAGYLYMADPEENRILRFTEDGHFAGEVKGDADRKLSSRIAVTRGYILAMDADGRKLHVWSTDGQPKLDVDLAPELGQANRPAPPIAVGSRKDVLILDAPEARVLRFQINF